MFSHQIKLTSADKKAKKALRLAAKALQKGGGGAEGENEGEDEEEKEDDDEEVSLHVILLSL